MNKENIIATNDFEKEKELFGKALEELKSNETKKNKNMALVEHYYNDIKKLLASGHTLISIAKKISETTSMSEATFRKNYNEIKNKKSTKKVAKTKTDTTPTENKQSYNKSSEAVSKNNDNLKQEQNKDFNLKDEI